MTKRAPILGAVVLTIVLTAFTGSALAGNGNGNGAGNGGNSEATPAAQPASPSPGNSANAPGQANKSTTTTASTTAGATTSPAVTSSTGGGGKSSGHAAKSGSTAKASSSHVAKSGSTAKTSSTTSSKGSASQNAGPQAGMKPTNATSKRTFCATGGSGSSATCAPSAGNAAGIASGKSDVSKRYGNGNTAAKIAVSRGAPAGTKIYGPGNSQPHKVETCPGSGHWVDVHAVKSYSTAACTASKPKSQPSVKVEHVCGETTVTTTTTESQHGHAYGLVKQGKALHTKTTTESVTTKTGEICSSSNSNVFQNLVPPIVSQATNTPSNASQTTGAQVAGSQVTAAGASATSGSTKAGGVLGATATPSAPGNAASGQPSGGVAGAVAAVGNVAGQTLPFTGFPLWIAVLIAAGLIVLGLGLRRRARTMI